MISPNLELVPEFLELVSTPVYMATDKEAKAGPNIYLYYSILCICATLQKGNKKPSSMFSEHYAKASENHSKVSNLKQTMIQHPAIQQIQ